MRSKATYLTVALVALLAVSVSFTFVMLSTVTPRNQVQAATSQGGGGVSCVLTIRVYDSQGNLKTTETVNDDIFTYNFFQAVRNVFQNSASGALSLYQNGTNSTDSWPAGSYGGGGLWGTAIGGSISYIGIGNSSVAPTIADYKLGNQLYSGLISSSAISISGTQINISLTTSFTITGANTITEADLVAYSGYNSHWYVMNHDTFTGVPVVVNDLVQVEYTYVLN